MRPQALVPPTRSVLARRATRATTRRILFSQSNSKSRDPANTSLYTNKTNRRALSSSKRWLDSELQHDQEEPNLVFSGSGGEDPSPDREEPNVVVYEIEKVKRTRRSTPKVEDVTSLPPGLDILWTPESDGPSSSSYASSTCLPAPELLEDVLSNFLITMQPRTQHRAAYASASGSFVEPTFALHCPIEGGDYIIDETVRELARRTDSEVITLDAAQLAAGESGIFGIAAQTALKLPQNPLHFRSSSSAEDDAEFEDQDEDDSLFRMMAASGRLSFRVISDGSGSKQGGRQGNAPQRPPASQKTKAFFDHLINIPSPRPSSEKSRPRIIYIRDYPLLAPSASSWYPSLLDSVRQRRQGPISRSTSPVVNPVTIIFGMTPQMIYPSSRSSSAAGTGRDRRHSPQGLLGLLNSRQPSEIVVSPPPKPDKHQEDEENAEKAREKRLRDRMAKWVKEDPSFYDDLPPLPELATDSSPSSAPSPSVIVNGSPLSGVPPSVHAAIQSVFGHLSGENRDGGDRDFDEVDSTQYFRTSVIIPESRDTAEERDARNFRRFELNLLIMRMALADIGARINEADSSDMSGTFLPARTTEGDTEKTDALPSEEPLLETMWKDWAENVQPWNAAKRIADRAVGSVLASSGSFRAKSLSDNVLVSWPVISHIWRAVQLRKDSRKEVVKKSWHKLSDTDKGFTERDEVGQVQPDTVIEEIKESPDLSQHERRLLSCIVDSASMPTSFRHVHLPDSTIDSVRTIVSLPLLFPSAFQHGILKQHSMSGCLLFGPPGTGKTLVVRALAKEAGCRMLAVAPSDVMDMYVGEGEKLVRSVFSLARRLSPCVIFLDEIDALLGARSSSRESGSAMAHHGVITEFMQEMDGLKTSKDSNVIVIGATNRPFDLDDAVLRRLPRRLLVDLPGEKERKEILRILLRNDIVADDVDFSVLAKRTDFFSGSDLKHLCVSAALDAVKESVKLPWTVTEAIPLQAARADVAQTNGEVEETQKEAANLEVKSSDESETAVPRVLHFRHFAKALREITPSSSESLGTLTALRKWNEEFGEGHSKKKRIMWGKGLFGFAESSAESDTALDGKVSSGS